MKIMYTKIHMLFLKCITVIEPYGPENPMDQRALWTREPYGPESPMDQRALWTREPYGPERLTSCFSTDARVLVHLKSEVSFMNLVKHQKASTSSSKMANNGAKRSVIPT